MMTDRKREQTEVREQNVPSDYLPQRGLAHAGIEFQTPNQSTGGISATVEPAFGDKPLVEAASLRNFSVR